MSDLLLQLDVLWPAIVAGLFVTLTHVPLGREVLSRGIIFLDLAVAQLAALGVIIAHLFFDSTDHDHAAHGHADEISLLFAISFALLGIIVLYRLRRLAVYLQEALIGMTFILSASGSILLLSTDPHGGERLREVLVGQILWIQANDLWLLGLVYSLVFVVWQWFNKTAGHWLFYPLFAITITLSTHMIGVYLVFATLIIPSLSIVLSDKKATPNNECMGLHLGFQWAYVISGSGYLLGIIVAALNDWPAGAAIVWVMTLISGVFVWLKRWQTAVK